MRWHTRREPREVELMNCKKGDLAIVVRCFGRTEYLGVSVTCLELVNPITADIVREDGPVWRVDRMFDWYCGGYQAEHPWIPDHCLSPISPGADIRQESKADTLVISDAQSSAIQRALNAIHTAGVT